MTGYGVGGPEYPYPELHRKTTIDHAAHPNQGIQNNAHLHQGFNLKNGSKTVLHWKPAATYATASWYSFDNQSSTT